MEINAGDTSWVLVCTALVFLMAPGLALFYGGLVRAKSSLNMMMMTFIAVGIVGVLWTLFGFSISFGDSGNGFFGGFDSVGLGELLNQLAVNGGKYPIPALAFAMFQLMFAIITVALISGSIAAMRDRAFSVSATDLSSPARSFCPASAIESSCSGLALITAHRAWRFQRKRHSPVQRFRLAACATVLSYGENP
mgnify:CR=1 FL=1